VCFWSFISNRISVTFFRNCSIESLHFAICASSLSVNHPSAFYPYIVRCWILSRPISRWSSASSTLITQRCVSQLASAPGERCERPDMSEECRLKAANYYDFERLGCNPLQQTRQIDNLARTSVSWLSTFDGGRTLGYMNKNAGICSSISNAFSAFHEKDNAFSNLLQSLKFRRQMASQSAGC